ncbi:Uncharacterised protein [Mycoplasmopsis citelli]|uniref:Uncharacterized protein n=1 Tax=Mycoplasmopsis citelli TaxID=171281 RepID=A0A449B2Z5_9BACT|nr:hypothetical protein [Mycoplasmopsis citelli]VEU74953.1 Uncharacterised protein [Mycoplasmopsis citelli]
MNNWTNNKIKYFVILLLSIGAGIGGYYAYKHFQKPFQKQKQDDHISETQEEINIFPELQESYFEDFLSTKNSEKIINEDLVYELINDLAKRINVPEGNINFHWEIISEYEINIYVKILSNNHEYKKAYKFKLDYE